jgi:hypothetical protein
MFPENGLGLVAFAASLVTRSSNKSACRVTLQELAGIGREAVATLLRFCLIQPFFSIIEKEFCPMVGNAEVNLGVVQRLPTHR